MADLDLDALGALFHAGAGAVLSRARFGEDPEPATSPCLVRAVSAGRNTTCRLSGRPYRIGAGELDNGLAYDVGGEHHDTLDVRPALVRCGRSAIEAGLRSRLGDHLESFAELLTEIQWDLGMLQAIREGGLPVVTAASTAGPPPAG